MEIAQPNPEAYQQDFLLWEQEVDSHLFSEYFVPENEVYGRSLSTIRRLGTLMVGGNYPEVIASPEAAQAKVEFFTSVEEGFGTDMELGGGLEVRDFDEREIVNGRVMAKDLKTAITDMTKSGLRCAVESRKKDERFYPQLVRSTWDHNNALLVDEMAKGNTDYNTRIVVSPFPEEAAAKSGEGYWRNIGYVPHLKRGFVQLYHKSPDGKLVAGSLSFDGSNKVWLRAVFAKFGVQIPVGESTDNWLQYAITDTLSEDAAKEFATELADIAADPHYNKQTNTVDVTRRYRPLIERVFEESYIHLCESLASGEQTNATKNLIRQFLNRSAHYNAHYSSALNKMNSTTGFNNSDAIVLHELLVYSTIEMMRELHVKETQLTNKHIIGKTDALVGMMSLDQLRFQDLLGSFVVEGAKNNRTYSACGLSISVGDEKKLSPESSPQSVFGGVDGKQESGKRWMNCPHCRAKVYGDPCAKILSCWDCRAKVVNGKVVSRGDGGHKARAERARQEQKRRREANPANSARILV